MTHDTDTLAIDGGTPVASEPVPGGAHGPAEIGEEEIEAVTAVLRSKGVFRFLDPENSRCAELEGKFRELTGCEHALAVGGGTAALVSGLVGIGVGEGDEVIIPGYTYIASAAAVLICGAVPVIAEIDESLTIDPADAESKITERTRAIMPVHMRGIPCDMDAIMDVANRHNLDVIEDTAQACGGFYKGKALGSFGRVGCFSLQQFKMMTAGEGGMVVTNDREVFERAAIRHDSAMCFWKPEDTNVRPFPGSNFRMNEMEGALGCVQFGRMAGILARTRAIKKQILEGLEGVAGIRVHESPCPEGECGIQASFFLDSNDDAKYFAEALRAEGIPCGSLYDKGIPDRHIYCYWEYVMEKGSAHRTGWPWTSPKHDQSRTYSPDMCPKTLDVLGRNVVVGIHQNLSDAHVELIVAGVRKVANAMAASGCA
jgi:dTDP-4-amino-4,6-dideoxygalactose transaminase